MCVCVCSGKQSSLFKSLCSFLKLFLHNSIEYEKFSNRFMGS